MIPGRHRRLVAPDGAAVVPVLGTVGRAAHRPRGRRTWALRRPSAPVGARRRHGRRTVAPWGVVPCRVDVVPSLAPTAAAGADRCLLPWRRWPSCSRSPAAVTATTGTSCTSGCSPPAWGYLDQPPLTPLIVHLYSTLVADSTCAVRIPATVAATASVLVLALVTRELGGGRAAQGLCAWAYAFASVPLLFGHVMLTATPDLVVWPAVVLLGMRALLRHESARAVRRWPSSSGRRTSSTRPRMAGPSSPWGRPSPGTTPPRSG
jgi:hypothetical protein